MSDMERALRISFTRIYLNATQNKSPEQHSRYSGLSLTKTYS